MSLALFLNCITVPVGATFKASKKNEPVKVTIVNLTKRGCDIKVVDVAGPNNWPVLATYPVCGGETAQGEYFTPTNGPLKVTIVVSPVVTAGEVHHITVVNSVHPPFGFVGSGTYTLPYTVNFWPAGITILIT